MRIQMPRGRESGLVALSSYITFLFFVWFMDNIVFVLDFSICCYVMHFSNFNLVSLLVDNIFI